MPHFFLALLCGLIVPGATTAKAAGIGVSLRVHAYNIPHGVAGGGNLHVGAGAGARAPARSHLNARTIQLDGAGKSAATRLPK